MSRGNLLILGVLFSVTSFDTLLLGFTIPRLISEYGISHAQAGLLGTILMAGIGAGALILGSLSDFTGRKNVILLALFTFSASTGILGVVKGYVPMSILVFASGFGLGGSITMTIAYLPEIVNRSLIARYMCYLESFWGVGALLIVTASSLLVRSSLQDIFFIGVLPVLLIPFLWKLPDVPPSGKENLTGSLKTLLVDYRKVTFVLWVIWFCAIYTYFGVFLWLPEIFISLLRYGVSGNFILIPIYAVQILSPLLLSRIVEGKNTGKLMGIYSLLAAASAMLFIATSLPSLVIIGIFLASFFSIGSWALLILLTPESYPQSIRGLGVGSAASIGRAGGIMAPYITGHLIGITGSYRPSFVVFIAMFALMALFAFILPTTEQEGMFW
jgi:putative MFS transporter